MFEMNKIEIIIIDSGVKCNHSSFQGVSICGFQIYNSNIIEDFEDTYGHGTAIYGIIKKVGDVSNIINIKLPNIEEGINENDLINVLKYILNNMEPNIINLSLGINIINNLSELYSVCRKLAEKGVIIVSAFDNTGAFSYPAAFDCVIGVTTDPEISNSKDFVFIDDNIVNIAAFGRVQRLEWATPESILLGGNSFACAHVTVQISKYLYNGAKTLSDVLNCFKNEALKEYKNTCHKQRKSFIKVEKAALFPFNKEMHSLIRYSHLLNFDIVDLYDSKYSAKVGASTNVLMSDENILRFTVKNIEKIDWDSIDTLIIGHLDELSRLLGSNELKKNLLQQAIQRKKNVYSFDDLTTIFDGCIPENVYFPRIDESDLPMNRYGMLYRISKPVIAVFGTSSKQGKFTLQLKLREMFLRNNYSVGQIGTEPSALLFGMEYVFPMGYGNSVHINSFNTILYLNSIINDLCLQNKDVILTGSQSGTIPYDTGNLQNFTINQTVFLMGVQPDVVVMCINPFDDIDYIRRTKSFIESCIDTVVLAFVVFPMNLKNELMGIYGGVNKLNSEEYRLICERLKNEFDIPVFLLGNDKDMEKLFNELLSYFK